jgi:hypothetical protein
MKQMFPLTKTVTDELSGETHEEEKGCYLWDIWPQAQVLRLDNATPEGDWAPSEQGME